MATIVLKTKDGAIVNRFEVWKYGSHENAMAAAKKHLMMWRQNADVQLEIGELDDNRNLESGY